MDVAPGPGAVRPGVGGLDGRAYLRLVLLGAAIGVPAALVAALFLALVHDLEHWLWHDLSDALGYSSPPWFLVIGLPVVGAVVVVAARLLLPGDGGHPPLEGISMAPTPIANGRASRSQRSARSPSVPCSGGGAPWSRSAPSSASPRRGFLR